ncbi:unnamed protein product, partial [Scytosiphon promiscuus]
SSLFVSSSSILVAAADATNRQPGSRSREINVTMQTPKLFQSTYLLANLVVRDHFDVTGKRSHEYLSGRGCRSRSRRRLQVPVCFEAIYVLALATTLSGDRKPSHGILGTPPSREDEKAPSPQAKLSTELHSVLDRYTG